MISRAGRLVSRTKALSLSPRNKGKGGKGRSLSIVVVGIVAFSLFLRGLLSGGSGALFGGGG